MRLGIDFGTSRIVVAAADRGNFPLAAFECPDGGAREWFPPLVAVRGDEWLYGWEAWAAQADPDATVVRSLKRCLAEAGPHTKVPVGAAWVGMLDLLSGLVAALKRDLTERASLTIKPNEKLEVLLGVPANANSNQRFLTLEAFRLGGFEVLGLLNEPSAASIEYAHKLGATKLPERILVYDLGGGTFDASLVETVDGTHSVVATEGISTLGGDDFDEILAECALEAGGLASQRRELSAAIEFRLLEECREKKEALHPNTRRLVIDLDRVRDGWGQVSVAVPDYYERCEPLILETLDATGDMLDAAGGDDGVSLYVTGGGSDLPLVGRLLRERFGRRMKRSAYARAATAIGLAIQCSEQSGFKLQERFSRYFGVWREADAGRTIVFDSLFDRGTVLPSAAEPALVRSRRYQPVHNVGHFRYLECSQRSEDSQPSGDLAAWDEIRFPFDPALASLGDLSGVAVTYMEGTPPQEIEERYAVNASGAVEVTISNRTSGYHRTYRLGRWAAEQATVAPTTGRRKRKAGA